MNGDGRTDVVCVDGNGGVMVWEVKDVDDKSDIYDLNSKWTHLNFGFCTYNDKQVTFLSGECRF